MIDLAGHAGPDGQARCWQPGGSLARHAGEAVALSEYRTIGRLFGRPFFDQISPGQRGCRVYREHGEGISGHVAELVRWLIVGIWEVDGEVRYLKLHRKAAYSA